MKNKYINIGEKGVKLTGAHTRARTATATPAAKAVKERDVEAALVVAVKAKGGLCLKYFNPAAVGYPDRIVIMPGCPAFWVELKAPGQKPRRIQEIRIEALRALGQRVEVVDSVEQAIAIVNESL